MTGLAHARLFLVAFCLLFAGGIARAEPAINVARGHMQPLPVTACGASEDIGKLLKDAQTHAPNGPMSATEIAEIRAQIYRCWNIPAGGKDAAALSVPIHVRLRPDGTVISAEHVGDMQRYNTDSYYRSTADLARRAVLTCSPLKAPPSKYEQWKELILRFNPKEMVGQ
jgi:hypothetical protein